MPAHVISVQEPPLPSFRERLQIELAQRCARNPRYSLRAFTAYLGTDHATLSQMLRGRRPVTAATVKRLGARIGLAASEIEAHLVALETTPPPRSSALSDDAAEVFGQWHAFAILELMRLPAFRPDVGWIARVLGLDVAAVQVALQHLLRLGFLQMAAADRWVDLSPGTVLREEEFTVLALERLAARSRALLQASGRVAAAAPRWHGSLTLALDESGLQRLLALAERSLAEAQPLTAATAEVSDRLYQLEIHCIPLTDPHHKRSDPP